MSEEKYYIKKSTLVNIADTLRSYLGTSSSIPVADINDKIKEVAGGDDGVHDILTGGIKEIKDSRVTTLNSMAFGWDASTWGKRLSHIELPNVTDSNITSQFNYLSNLQYYEMGNDGSPMSFINCDYPQIQVISLPNASSVTLGSTTHDTLKTLNIPKADTVRGDYGYSYPALQDIYMWNGNSDVKTIGSLFGSYNGYLNTSCKFHIPNMSDKSIYISAYAFGGGGTALSPITKLFSNNDVYIYSSAFSNCSTLGTLYFGPGCSISNAAFYECQFHQDNMTFDNCKYVNVSIFYNCQNYTKTLSVYGNLNGFGEMNATYNYSTISDFYAPNLSYCPGFMSHKSIKTVTFADEYTGMSIGINGSSFFASPIEVINIASNTQSSQKNILIGYGAFDYCSSIREINLPKVSGQGLLSLGGTLSKNKLTQETVDGLLNKNSIFSKVTINSWYMFASNQNISYISSPISDLGSYQGIFKDCTNLTEANIYLVNTGIPSSAFHNCSALSSISIGSNISYISDYAFCNCSDLNNIEWYKYTNLHNIGNNAFDGCRSLTGNLTSCYTNNIGSYAFRGTGLTAIGYLPYNRHLFSIINGSVSHVFDNIQIQELNSNTLSNTNGNHIGRPRQNESIFANCSRLNKVDITFSAGSNYDYGLSGMFYNCISLSEASIKCEATETYSRCGLNRTFINCTALQKLDLTTDGPAYIDLNNAFSCANLNNITFYLDGSYSTDWTVVSNVYWKSSCSSDLIVTIDYKSNYHNSSIDNINKLWSYSSYWGPNQKLKLKSDVYQYYYTQGGTAKAFLDAHGVSY